MGHYTKYVFFENLKEIGSGFPIWLQNLTTFLILHETFYWNWQWLFQANRKNPFEGEKKRKNPFSKTLESKIADSFTFEFFCLKNFLGVFFWNWEKIENFFGKKIFLLKNFKIQKVLIVHINQEDSELWSQKKSFLWIFLQLIY